MVFFNYGLSIFLQKIIVTIPNRVKNEIKKVKKNTSICQHPDKFLENYEVFIHIETVKRNNME